MTTVPECANGHKNLPEDQFCTTCGLPLAQQLAPSQPTVGMPTPSGQEPFQLPTLQRTGTDDGFSGNPVRTGGRRTQRRRLLMAAVSILLGGLLAGYFLTRPSPTHVVVDMPTGCAPIPASMPTPSDVASQKQCASPSTLLADSRLSNIVQSNCPLAVGPISNVGWDWTFGANDIMVETHTSDAPWRATLSRHEAQGEKHAFLSETVILAPPLPVAYGSSALFSRTFNSGSAEKINLICFSTEKSWTRRQFETALAGSAPSMPTDSAPVIPTAEAQPSVPSASPKGRSEQQATPAPSADANPIKGCVTDAEFRTVQTGLEAGMPKSQVERIFGSHGQFMMRNDLGPVRDYPACQHPGKSAVVSYMDSVSMGTPVISIQWGYSYD